ncbi:hydrolase-4 domain-containing protein [Favolaschia claudopus]|uniref:Hydrolase-4 domain-containing protein n=1 Tax=Favolaschia claudopus TaxID=2862362 RepID=A0AAV9Z7J3_9AGAR
MFTTRHGALFAIIFVTSSFNLWLLTYAPNFTPDMERAPKKSAWIADDFPEFWQLPANEIAMVVEESFRYSITGIDAKEDWASNSPAGFGYLRLGPEKRHYALDLAHQLHCLCNIRGGLAGDHSPKMQWHIQHCLNFLRMMFLCMPNLTLEPANVLERNFEVHRTGATHVCRDWRHYFEKMEENWYNFLGNRSSVFDE